MPVESLTDEGAAAYRRYAGPPSRADLERVFFLEDQDRAQVAQRRGQHMKLGFALQLVTVRWLGTFRKDPLDVPGAVLEFVAEQVESATCLISSWRSRPGRGYRTWSGGARTWRRARRARRSSRRWTRWPTRA
ncbi:DUF4158 domain-containing protein [Nocardiopsis dassonvillei subsp. albirubida]|uniref:DUF4158 domain-containing protein n=1 Tax=Nocardiopsis alborubida TaxID=146802 RepID=A0A7X6MAT2_9ACTN|nr:DUF4158 domain-containing protein [Nocardiopsis alborubida]